MHSSVASSVVPLVLARLRELGLDPAGLVGVHRLGERASGELMFEAMLSFVNGAAALSGDPYFGLHLGAAYKPGLLGALELYCSTVPTLGAACERMVRSARLLHPELELSLVVEGESAYFGRDLPGQHSRHEGRHLQEFFMATLVQIARALTHTGIRLKQVGLSRRAPSDPGELVRFFGTSELEFEAERVGFAFPREYLVLPCGPAGRAAAAQI
ncbi:MAG: AraC family transcriptional regulator ligand-binding domain-containing protein [Myxococcales bacterium]